MIDNEQQKMYKIYNKSSMYGAEAIETNLPRDFNFSNYLSVPTGLEIKFDINSYLSNPYNKNKILYYKTEKVYLFV